MQDPSANVFGFAHLWENGDAVSMPSPFSWR